MFNEPEDFRSWLMRVVDEQSPVGDLARDVRDDDAWPEDEVPQSFELYEEYLESVNACQGALDALEDAWRRYNMTRA